MAEDRILLTARYVEGDMDETERIGFEMRVRNEADLQQHLADYTAIHKRLRIYLAPDRDDTLFRDSLISFNDEFFSPKAKVVFFGSLLKWATAVAAILLVGLVVWAPWKKTLYTDYAADTHMSVAERGADKESNLERAAKFYNEKNFNAAKILLEKEYKLSPENSLVAYYYGNTLVETNNVEHAQTVLVNVYNGVSVFKYDAAYSIALSYLKNNDKQTCKVWLLKIPKGSARYKIAQELITEL